MTYKCHDCGYIHPIQDPATEDEKAKVHLNCSRISHCWSVKGDAKDPGRITSEVKPLCDLCYLERKKRAKPVIVG